MKRSSAFVFITLLAACTVSGPLDESAPGPFLRMYNEVDQQLQKVAGEANWQAATDVAPEATGARIGAEAAAAAFRGSPPIIEFSQDLLDSRDNLTDLEFRQLDKILLLAAESPGTIPEIVDQRIKAEARLEAAFDGYQFCLERRGGSCVTPLTLTEVENVLRNSADLRERRQVWEAFMEAGRDLKAGLAQVRDLRNRAARELGYTSYFHLQVADYGMSVDELMELMAETIEQIRPLYGQVHELARRRLAGRYGAEVPERIPAHWLPEQHGQSWGGLIPALDFDGFLEGRSAEWIVQQAERFYVSLGMEPLPDSFWQNSDFYPVPADSGRRKNIDARTWHIDRDKDIRTLLSIVPNFRWFETAHHELGHAHYYLAYSNSDVPPVLREGLNRAFHEAIGHLIGMAARQEPYLRELRLVPEDQQLDPGQLLLAEALEDALVFVPWAAGVVTHFEYELYEGELPEEEFNRHWWELKAEYQGIEPPEARGEEFCDGCTKSHVIDDPAQYYDYVLSHLIKFQLHDYICREILEQDPHQANYYGNEDVGEWLLEILELGATRDWREVLREKTGEDLSSRAMLEYFQPLSDVLAQ